MSLNHTLSEIANYKVQAEADVDMGHPSTYSGRLGLKKAAIEKLKQLRLEYRNKLMSSVAFILVSGPNKDAFQEVATSDAFGCFASDPDSMFKEIAGKVNPTLFGRESTRHLFNVVSNLLEDKCLELDIDSYPMVLFNDKYNQPSTTVEEFSLIVRNAIVDQVGSELVGINALHSIVDAAIAKNHDSQVTPILLTTSDEKFAFDLNKNLKRLTNKVFLVVVGKASKELSKADGAILVKDVNEDSVGRALSTIRNKVL